MTTVWFNTSTPTQGRVRVPGLVGLSIDGPRDHRRAATPTVSTRDAGGRLRSATRPPARRRSSHDFPLDAAAR